MSIEPGIYEHYKGRRYEVMGIAIHSETEEAMVLYKALYKSNYPDGTLWARPLEMFKENVLVGGRQVPRFKFIHHSP